MPDTHSFPTPSEDEWDKAAKRGEAAARAALFKVVQRHMRPGQNQLLTHAVLYGGIVEAARFIRTLTRPDALPVLERNVLAMVRGALRGEDGHARWLMLRPPSRSPGRTAGAARRPGSAARAGSVPAPVRIEAAHPPPYA